MSMINLNHVSVVDYNLGGSLNPFSVWALATRTEPGIFSSGQPYLTKPKCIINYPSCQRRPAMSSSALLSRYRPARNPCLQGVYGSRWAGIQVVIDVEEFVQCGNSARNQILCSHVAGLPNRELYLRP